MSRASQRLRRIFERRYMTAFVLLAVATTVSFGASYRVSMIETNRAQAIILVTEQRALSQRVAFLIKAIERAQNPARADQLRDELSATIDKMHGAHRILMGQSEKSVRLQRFISPLEGIYRQGYAPFDREVLDFLERARTIAAIDPFSPQWEAARTKRDEIIVSATNSMMQTHGLMVRILEAKARENVKFSKIVDIAIWALILTLLCLVTFIIFRPMRNEITRAFEEVEGARNRANEAQEKAVEAEAAKGKFFQTASHELRTPLNAILGMTDVIASRSGTEFQDEVSQIAAAGDHLLALLNNILDANRMADGNLEVKLEPFKLHEAINRATTVGAALARQKGLKFREEVDLPKDIRIRGDAARLEQVLVNLLDNAARFTTEGEVVFKANLEQTEEVARPTLNIIVSDTGDGIPPEKLGSIFDKFSGQGPKANRAGGLGVGLAIAREVVQQMGGTIEVNSDVGKGSSFTVSMPLDLVDAETAEEVANFINANAGGDTEEAEAKSCDILIVDDNLANRMVAEALVKPMGARTVLAVDGRQAVEKAEAERFDIILMDISMPVMDGYEATAAIREQDGPNKKTPIIALTAHVDAGDIDDLKEKGFQDIINKPVRKDTLRNCIERHLHRAMFVDKAA